MLFLQLLVAAILYVWSVGACAKLRNKFPEVSVVCLLDVWFGGMARFEVAVSSALGRGLLAQLLYVLELC